MRRTGGLRPRAYALLCLYGGMLANGVPRLANASYDVVMAAMLVGMGFYGLAAVLFVVSAVKLPDHGNTRGPGTSQSEVAPPAGR